MKHIAFIHKDFPCSGAEQVTIDVANYLQRHGCRVTILAINHREVSYPVGTERLFQVTMLPQGKMKRSRRVAKAVRDFILSEHVDVLVTYRELLYAHWLKKETGVRIVFELHNTPFYEFLDIADKRRESLLKNIFYGCGIEWGLRRFYKSKYQRVYGWCDAYGVLCESYRDELVGHLSLDPNKNKVYVLPNSISMPPQMGSTTSPANPASAASVGQHGKTVVYVGRLTHRDKRVDRLLRIWQRAQDSLPDWQLKIVGQGKDAPQLKELASKLGLQRCSFEGYSVNVSQYYNEASIICLTSSFEGWPMCIAEAQAHGVVPVVFSSFSGAASQISSESEGVLVEPYNEEAFATQIVALAHDATRLSNMRKAVRQKAATYTIQRSGEAWQNMIDSLLEGNR